MRLLFISAIAISVTACSSQSANMRVGTAQSLASLEDQRAAVREVVIVDSLPDGALEMDAVDASRCHRDFTDRAPSDDLVLQDLKVTAYARGADGIHSVETSRTTGLLRNCWYTITARGIMFQRPQTDNQQ